MEQWKEVVNYEGLYEVSNYGRVRNSKTKQIKSQHDNGKGYMGTELYKEGTGTRLYVHRLVVEAFIGIIPKDMEVDHKNNIRNDNRLENLQILTPSENNMKKSIDSRTKQGHKLEVYYKDGKIEQYRSISECSRSINIHRDTLTKYFNEPVSEQGWKWGSQRMEALGIIKIIKI